MSVIHSPHNLSAENIVEIDVEPEEIVPLNFSWIEFDFNDIMVEVGNTYYIVSYTENITDNFYAWGANNDTESYPFGSAWISIDDGETWTNESEAEEENQKIIKFDQFLIESLDNETTWDMCFKTYGIDNTPPTAPVINGQTSGKPGKEYEYIITGSDADDDELFVMVNWGDNTCSEWLGPYAGNYEITLKHSWSEKGNYSIKAVARDPYGYGPEGTLDITMPKNKQANIYLIILQQIFEWFPNIVKILNMILRF